MYWDLEVGELKMVRRSVGNVRVCETRAAAQRCGRRSSIGGSSVVCRKSPLTSYKWGQRRRPEQRVTTIFVPPTQCVAVLCDYCWNEAAASSVVSVIVQLREVATADSSSFSRLTSRTWDSPSGATSSNTGIGSNPW